MGLCLLAGVALEVVIKTAIATVDIFMLSSREWHREFSLCLVAWQVMQQPQI
jgi:hypothetical protein